MKTIILSSIPGRMRLKIEGLLYNKNIMYFLKESLQSYHGIISVEPNTVTGNMLVYYNAELEDILGILNRISSISINNLPSVACKNRVNQVHKLTILNKKTILKNLINKYPTKIYNNEYELSGRLMTFSIVISGLVLLVSFNLDVALSVIVFGFPGILFLIRRNIFKIAQKNFKYNNFNFNNSNLVFKLADVEHLLIEDSILSHKINTSSAKDFTGLPYDNAINLIKKFRKLGLIDITMISRENDDINNYIGYILCINRKQLDCNLSNDEDFLKNLSNKDKTAAIIKNDDLKELRKSQIIVFKGYKNLELKADDFVIAFQQDGVNKIPYVIETSKYCNKIAIRSQNIAISINTIGIFLSISKLITPLSSIALYVLNFYKNIVYIKTLLSQHEKEYLNEI